MAKHEKHVLVKQKLSTSSSR